MGEVRMHDNDHVRVAADDISLECFEHYGVVFFNYKNK